MNLIPNKESYFGQNVHRNLHRKDLELVLHQPHTLKRAIRKSWHPQSTPILGKPRAKRKSTLQNGPSQGSSFPHGHQLYEYMIQLMHPLRSSSFQTTHPLFLPSDLKGKYAVPSHEIFGTDSLLLFTLLICSVPLITCPSFTWIDPNWPTTEEETIMHHWKRSWQVLSSNCPDSHDI